MDIYIYIYILYLYYSILYIYGVYNIYILDQMNWIKDGTRVKLDMVRFVKSVKSMKHEGGHHHIKGLKPTIVTTKLRP